MEAENGAANVRGGGGEQASLENQDLSFLLSTVSSFFSDYGWYLLLLSGGAYLLIQYLSKYRSSQDRSSASSSSTANTDPVSVVRRQEALEASRLRMQAELDAKAAEFKEKQQRLEEEKRQQKIEMWESMKDGKSYIGKAKLAQSSDEAASSSTVLKPKTEKKSLRSSGYNPLAGDGGGTCAWRPGRRGPSAGG